MADEIKRTNTPTPTKQQKNPFEKTKKGVRLKDSAPFVFDENNVILIESGGKEKKAIIDTDGKIKFKKGGRAGLKGGGICKRGMNRDAIGKNS